LDVFFGWNGYAMQGNSYNLREKLRKEVENELQIRTLKRRQNMKT